MLFAITHKKTPLPIGAAKDGRGDRLSGYFVVPLSDVSPAIMIKNINNAL
jgi:hypothetical protein